MSHSRVFDRLTNWGRYWRDHDGEIPHCRSLEHKYLRQFDDEAPSLIAAEEAQEERASKPPAPEMRDAIIVNEAWKRMEPKTKHKQVLQWSFCYGRLSDQTIANRARIHVDQLPLKFGKACREIARILDTPNFIDTIPLDNPCISPVKDTPAQTENPTALDAASVSPEELGR